ncbi:flavodoxin [Geofilum rhodophaeum]|uniref:flavodoxin n=1 Tax=Geofilum rhodophaeum TaxID=1965019 RepID=UPI000B52680E|nr:flavodoxin [Geofilum rhodophaeum]
MKKLGIFYGTSTGNTEYVAKLLVKELGDYDVHLADIARVKNVRLLEDFDYLILASSTWNFGDLQDDWMDRKAVLEGLNLKGKKVALLGLGDASAYPENFVDSIGILYDLVSACGAEVVGKVAIKGYDFDESKALRNGSFVGLPIDEENEGHLTKERLKQWALQLHKEF